MNQAKAKSMNQATEQSTLHNQSNSRCQIA